MKKHLIFRIDDEQKERWKKISTEKNISLTNLIISAVENRFQDAEKRKVIAFIEKQDNIFAKIENNINQFARIANGQRFISEATLLEFNKQLKEIAFLKKKQNEIFAQIYKILADGH